MPERHGPLGPRHPNQAPEASGTANDPRSQTRQAEVLLATTHQEKSYCKSCEPTLDPTHRPALYTMKTLRFAQTHVVQNAHCGSRDTTLVGLPSNKNRRRSFNTNGGRRGLADPWTRTQTHASAKAGGSQEVVLFFFVFLGRPSSIGTPASSRVH